MNEEDLTEDEIKDEISTRKFEEEFQNSTKNKKKKMNNIPCQCNSGCKVCVGRAAYLCTRKVRDNLFLCTRCKLSIDTINFRLFDEEDIPNLIELDYQGTDNLYDKIFEQFGGIGMLLKDHLSYPKYLGEK
jgi:hypothetical protein